MRQLRAYDDAEYRQVRGYDRDTLGRVLEECGSEKTVVREKDGYKTTWTKSQDKGMVDVVVEKDGKTIIEWSYPKIKGVGRSLATQADFWLDQAILEAKSHE